MTVEQGVSADAESVDTAEGDDEQESPSTRTTDEDSDTTAAARPSKSEIFDLVSSHRRRYTIHYCKQQDGPVELADLAEYVAARELEKEITELTSNERKRVYTSLQQTHLPRLERAGMITDDRGTIELTDKVSDLEIYLDIVPKRSVPWGVYYLGLSAISALVLALLYAEILPTQTIGVLGWATLILLMFAVSAVIHTIDNRAYRLDQLDSEPE